MTIFAGVDDEGFVVVQVGNPDPGDVGPPAPAPEGPYAYYPVDARIPGTSRPTPTSRLKWVDDAMVWVETASLAELKASAVASTYVEVDAVYETAIGRRTTEYTNAEIAARAYKAAGFVGPVSGYISGHAEHNPTGLVQSYEWATQAIIERADAFKWAELQLRNMRFSSQAAMRAATSAEDLRAAAAGWDDFIAWLRGILGL